MIAYYDPAEPARETAETSLEFQWVVRSQYLGYST